VGNLTFSEIIWIVVIILIVFGPQRLPEMARKVGQFVAKARDAANALQKQITEEYGDAITPLKDVGEELKEVRRSLTDSAKSAARDLEETTRIKDVTEELKNAQRQIVDDAAAASEPSSAPDAEVAPGEQELPSADGDS
jgi:sec-independent protein translocase protein TatB